MKIDRTLEIYDEELPSTWIWNPDRYVGGTHEFVFNIAKYASEMFSEVVVYYDGKPGKYGGVYYMPRSQYSGTDVVLACNSIPSKLGKFNIAWLSWSNAKDSDYIGFDDRIVISKYHQSLFGNNSRVVGLGVDYKDFADPVKKIEGQCLFSSSPDRGKSFLLSIWDRVKMETGAKLITTYDTDISEKEMIDNYKKSQFWLHPGLGIELFCLSAVKAQMAGCIPVYVPHMALDETVKYGVETSLDRFSDDLIQAIKFPPPVKPTYFPTWYTVAKEIFKNV